MRWLQTRARLIHCDRAIRFALTLSRALISSSEALTSGPIFTPSLRKIRIASGTLGLRFPLTISLA